MAFFNNVRILKEAVFVLLCIYYVLKKCKQTAIRPYGFALCLFISFLFCFMRQVKQHNKFAVVQHSKLRITGYSRVLERIENDINI